MATVCQMATPLICYPAQQPLYQPSVPYNYQPPVMCMPFPSCGQPIIITLPQVPGTAAITAPTTPFAPATPQSFQQPQISTQTTPFAPADQLSSQQQISQIPDSAAPSAPTKYKEPPQKVEQVPEPDEVSLRVVITPPTPECSKRKGTPASARRRDTRPPAFLSDSRFREPPFHSTGFEETLHRSGVPDLSTSQVPSQLLTSDFINMFKEPEQYKFDEINVSGLSNEQMCVVNLKENISKRKKNIFEHLNAARAIKQRLACGAEANDEKELLKMYRQHKRDAAEEIQNCVWETHQLQAVRSRMKAQGRVGNRDILPKVQAGVPKQDGGYKSLMAESRVSTSESRREDGKVKKTIILPAVDPPNDFEIQAEVVTDQSPENQIQSGVEDAGADVTGVTSIAENFDRFLRTSFITHLRDEANPDLCHTKIEPPTDRQTLIVNLANNIIQRKKNIMKELLAAKSLKEQLESNADDQKRENLLVRYRRHKNNALREIKQHLIEEGVLSVFLKPIEDRINKSRVIQESNLADESSEWDLLKSAIITQMKAAADEQAEIMNVKPTTEAAIYFKNVADHLIERKRRIVQKLLEAKAIKERLQSGQEPENRRNLLQCYKKAKREALQELEQYRRESADFSAIFENQDVQGSNFEEAPSESPLVHSSFINDLEKSYTTNNYDGINLLPLTNVNIYASTLLQILIRRKKIILDLLREAKRIKEVLESDQGVENRKKLLSDYRQYKKEAAENLTTYQEEKEHFQGVMEHIRNQVDEVPEEADVEVNVEVSTDAGGQDTERIVLPSFTEWFPEARYADDFSESKKAKIDEAKGVYGDLQRSYDRARDLKTHIGQHDSTDEKDEEERRNMENMLQSYFQHRRNEAEHLAKLRELRGSTQ